MSPPLPWGRVPTLDASTQRTHFPRWLREKGPFPERDAHAGGSHATSRHHSVTQPKDKSNQHHRTRALGPSGKAFPSCFPSPGPPWLRLPLLPTCPVSSRGCSREDPADWAHMWAGG